MPTSFRTTASFYMHHNSAFKMVTELITLAIAQQQQHSKPPPDTPSAPKRICPQLPPPALRKTPHREWSTGAKK
ncbi:hypothetical protein EJ06DRAFT_525873 [Trichodelitschia bisporula]|uniref:Uncharacterized protein n=1 Tax=Trichodelitschia bisporula TaxID=703511 RepID=A0A6G1IAK7_9PEZI|nr:hypothetical protein EJ06DRAFT_525873 [Trichodelitschia bisporula]